jgi:hypothetical protein
LSAELDVQSAAPLVALPPVAVTPVETEPIVAVGGGPFTPFMFNATGESAANPTEGGAYLNTENTFFYTPKVS